MAGLITGIEAARVRDNLARVRAELPEHVEILAAVKYVPLEELDTLAEVHDAGLCTMCRPDLFFSHRRAGGVTGRQAGVVWRV